MLNKDEVTVTGRITHIGFRNSENWATFTIEELIDEDNLNEPVADDDPFAFQKTISATGILPVMSDLHDVITITGKETVHPTYGPQIKCISVIPAPPEINTVKGIRKILCRLPGIGEAKAKRFTDFCEAEDMDILETAINRPELVGVRPGTEEECSQKVVMLTKYFDHLIYLLGIGLTDNQADRIVKEFGIDTIDIISDNPYVVIEKIPGFGFLMADKVAFKCGIKAGNPARTQACIQYVLKNSKTNGGNTWIHGWELTKFVIDQLTSSCAVCGTSVVGMPGEDEVRSQIYILQVDDKVVIDSGKVFDKGLLDAEMEILGCVDVGGEDSFCAEDEIF